MKKSTLALLLAISFSAFGGLPSEDYGETSAERERISYEYLRIVLGTKTGGDGSPDRERESEEEGDVLRLACEGGGNSGGGGCGGFGRRL